MTLFMAIDSLPVDLRSQAEQAATRLLRLAGMNSVPIDVGALATAQGIRRVRPLPLDASAHLLELGGFYIFYNSAEVHGRQRFSICHEIAHTFFVDAKSASTAGIAIRARLKRPLNSHEEEDLCEYTAAELIMPRSSFIEAVEAVAPCALALRELSKQFGVTAAAVLRRIETLGLQWPCLMLSWEPVESSGILRAFRLTKQQAFGGFGKAPFQLEATLSLAGMHKTYDVLRRRRESRIVADMHEGFRFQSRARFRNGNVEVWSLVTRQPDQRG
jgi:hypothetical protein